MKRLVTYELEDSVATITMDDGKVNVLSLAMLRGAERAPSTEPRPTAPPSS